MVCVDGGFNGEGKNSQADQNKSGTSVSRPFLLAPLSFILNLLLKDDEERRGVLCEKSAEKTKQNPKSSEVTEPRPHGSRQGAAEMHLGCGLSRHRRAGGTKINTALCTAAAAPAEKKKTQVCLSLCHAAGDRWFIEVYARTRQMDEG